MDYNINSDDDFEGSYNSSSKDIMNNNENSQTKNPNGLSKAELRRSNKPIMEKRRRARINHCLNELKSLILEAMKKDPARHTKLEKADILEMTVKHLQSIQRRQLSMAIQTDPTVIHKFKTGFVECAEEVKRYIGQLDGVDTGTRQRLSNYLNNCASSLDQIGSFTNFSNGYAAHSVQNFNNAAVFPNQMGYPVPHDPNNNGRTQIGGVKLIPSLLPSGELALIMPNTKVNLIKPNINETLPFSVRSVPTINDDFTANFPRASAFSKPSTKRVFSTPNYHDINASVPVSVTTTSPPLSPISSSSSQEDQDSMMHTSSDFASRSITPSLDHSHSSISGGELTTPSSAESSKVFSRIADLQQLHGVPKTEADICPKRLYPYGNFDEPTVKKIKFEKPPNTDDNGNPKKAPAPEEPSDNMWRPW